MAPLAVMSIGVGLLQQVYLCKDLVKGENFTKIENLFQPGF